MKLHNFIVLTVVLLLSTQELLAGNARDLAQPSAIKSTITVPTSTTSKMTVIAPIRQGNVSAGLVATPGRTTVQKPTLPSRQVIARPRGAGPNLIVSVKYERDVCPADESRLRKNTFNARCDLIVTVKNVGDVPTDSENGSISISLMYYNYRNSLQREVLHINNLGINQKRVIVYDRFNLRDFRRTATITVFVDTEKLITETNENDNRAVFDLM
ncbi:MAG: hypothetical protein COA63_009045 [Methylophaga sp.]|nr:hypothetical protein [Methylophaga sp.]